MDAVSPSNIELADAALARFDVDAAITHLSAATRELATAGDKRGAAMACARLGDVFANTAGNRTAARAWFVRATRLLDGEPPCVEQGWVAVAALGCEVDNPDVLLANSELALDRARRFGDVNLEAKALADGGLAHVQAGRVDEGMALLDEAMALVCGPTDDDDAAGKSVCSFFTACYFACDFDRAASWVDVLRRRGLIGPAPGVQLFLAGHCEAVQATLLCELGQWSEAERVLLRADERFERGMGSPSWHPAIALAELRIRQGRLADAERLLLGKEASMQALLPAARLHLARGDLDLARATAERGLRALGADRLRSAELLALLVDVAIGAGDLDVASRRCAEMAERAARLEVPALAARLAATKARAAAAAGEVSEAIRLVSGALDATPEARLPFLRASLFVELARLYDRAGDATGAAVEAGRAAAAFDGLDVVVAEDDADLIRRLTSDRPAQPARGLSALTGTIAPAGRGWVITFGDDRTRVAASKGMAYLAELVAAPGVERHALDLVDRAEGTSAAVDRRRLGDAGEMLDPQARRAYQRRIEELRADIDEAFDSGADDKAMALQDEVDQLVGELARAFGVGGRPRRASSAAERARLNVTRALRTAVARIADALPVAGASLDRSLRTGLYCAYSPGLEEPRWIVQREVNGKRSN